MEDWFFLGIKFLFKIVIIIVFIIVFVIDYNIFSAENKRKEICNRMTDGDVKTFCLGISEDKKKCEQLKTPSLIVGCMNYK